MYQSYPMFKVNASYTKKNENNIYYVLAQTKAKARTKFKRFVSWLDIISIEACTQEEQDNVVANQDKFNIV